MVLDGLLADRSVTSLGSEREKAARYFKQHLGDGLREYPRLAFGKKPNATPHGDSLTSRYRLFRRVRSPMTSASFFLRVHRLICRSRCSASARVSCISE